MSGMTLILSVIVLAAALGLGAAPALAERPDEGIAALDAFTAELSRSGQFAGVVLVARHGRVVHEHAYGASDEETGQPSRTATRFNLASAGKMFTAVAVLQQLALGRATLDTPVGQILPDYPNRDFAAKVTLRHLLTHTAGAGDIDLFGTEQVANRARARSVAEMLALHAERAPAFEPGSQQAYGNFGHVVLGRIVEVLSGQRFEDYVRQHVFAPAGMTHSGFDDCGAAGPEVAAGYVSIGNRRLSHCITLPRRGFPAGGQVSTARDLLRFVTALKQGRLLPEPLFREATRTHEAFMGLGFFATGYGPGVPERDFRWGHGGSADGICTDVRHYPLVDETVIVLSNTDAPACFAVANFLHEQGRRP